MSIKSITLYKHGVAFFQRKVQVEGDEEVSLRFDPSQMDDVIKSLTVSDTQGGVVRNVAYDSAQPAPSRFSLQAGQALQSLLAQLVGIPVEVTHGSRKVEGSVLGCQLKESMSDNQKIQEPILVISTKEGVHQLPVFSIASLNILDKSIDEDLKRYLSSYLTQAQAAKKRVAVRCQGKGKRDIAVSYLVASPVWKTSYRMVLGAKQPELQAWGLVDNTTEDDWQDVVVTLVSGNPISFTYPLYAPRYSPRPHVGPQERAGLAPVQFASGTAPAMAPESYSSDEESGAGSSLGGLTMARAMRSKDAYGPAYAPSQLVSTIEEGSADLNEGGDYVECRIAHPVTIKKNESASLPLFHKQVEGKKVMVYNAEVNQKHPMASVDFKNTVGITLEAGPMLVVDQNTYVGEVLLKEIKTNDRRFLPYALETGVSVTLDLQQTSLPIHLIKVHKGLMYQYFTQVKHSTYKVVNKTSEAKTVVIEHPMESGYALMEPKKAAEETDTHYRFVLEVPAGKDKELVLKEHLSSSSTRTLSDASDADLRYYADHKYLSPALAAEVKEVIGIKHKMAELAKDSEKLSKEVQELATDQQRIRSNLSALGRSVKEEEIRNSYLESLTSSEKRIEHCRKEIKAIEAKILELKADFAKKLEAINFESKL